MDTKGSRAAYRSGGIRYRADRDCWVATTTVDVRGRRHRLEATGKTEPGARAALAKKRNGVLKANSTPRRKRSMTIRDYLATWLDQIRDDIRPTTWQSYESVVRNHVIPTVGDVKLDRMTPDDVRYMRTTIIERCAARDKAKKTKTARKGAGPSRARYAQTVLSVALAAAVRDELIPRNVADGLYVKKLPTPDKPVVALDSEQARRFLREAAERDGASASRWAFAFLTGARQGEILGLEIDRLDFAHETMALTRQLKLLPNRHGCGVKGADGWPCGMKVARACPERAFDISPTYAESVTVLEGSVALVPTKTKMSKRQLPMIGPLKAILQAHLQATADVPNPHGLVWRNDDGSPIQPRTDYTRWCDALTASGFDHVRLHSSRASVASMMSDLGVDREVIAEILGHTSLDTTAGYVAVGDQFRRDALDKVGSQIMVEMFGPK